MDEKYDLAEMAHVLLCNASPSEILPKDQRADWMRAFDKWLDEYNKSLAVSVQGDA